MRKVEVRELREAAKDVASRLVADLVCDLDDRKGFHWNSVDDETRAVWLDQWEAIARRHMETATSSDPAKLRELRSICIEVLAWLEGMRIVPGGIRFVLREKLRGALSVGP